MVLILFLIRSYHSKVVLVWFLFCNCDLKIVLVLFLFCNCHSKVVLVLFLFSNCQIKDVLLPLWFSSVLTIQYFAFLLSSARSLCCSRPFIPPALNKCRDSSLWRRQRRNLQQTSSVDISRSRYSGLVPLAASHQCLHGRGSAPVSLHTGPDHRRVSAIKRTVEAYESGRWQRRGSGKWSRAPTPSSFICVTDGAAVARSLEMAYLLGWSSPKPPSWPWAARENIGGGRVIIFV